MSIATQALLRHLLTIAGGFFAAKYGVDGDTLDAITSGATALAGVAWSLYDKREKP